MDRLFLNGRVRVKVGDLTAEPADAIVNAANSRLLGGGGVDGAIHKAGGSAILSACKEIRANQYPDGLPAGEAVLTTGGALSASYVIHTVGPIWRGGQAGEETLLENAYNNALQLAASKKMRTIAFPAISTGVYGFPADRAAKIVRRVLTRFVKNNDLPEEITLVFFSDKAATIFLSNCAFGDAQ